MKKIMYAAAVLAVLIQGCATKRTNVGEIDFKKSYFNAEVVHLEKVVDQKAEKGVVEFILGATADLLTSVSKKAVGKYADAFSREHAVEVRLPDAFQIGEHGNLLYVYRVVKANEKEREKRLEGIPLLSQEICSDLGKSISTITTNSGYKILPHTIEPCQDIQKEKELFLHFFAVFSIEPLDKHDETCRPFEIKLLKYAYPALLSKASSIGYFRDFDKPKSTLSVNLVGPKKEGKQFDTGVLNYSIKWTGKDMPKTGEDFFTMTDFKQPKPLPLYCEPQSRYGYTLKISLKDTNKGTENLKKAAEEIDFKSWYEKLKTDDNTTE